MERFSPSLDARASKRKRGSFRSELLTVEGQQTQSVSGPYKLSLTIKESRIWKSTAFLYVFIYGFRITLVHSSTWSLKIR